MQMNDAQSDKKVGAKICGIEVMDILMATIGVFIGFAVGTLCAVLVFVSPAMLPKVVYLLAAGICLLFAISFIFFHITSKHKFACLLAALAAVVSALAGYIITTYASIILALAPYIERSMFSEL
jgi:uncharacterized protein YacL